MGSNSNSKQKSKLASFSELRPFEQTAVILKAAGKTHAEIINQINAEFKLSYSNRGADDWFRPGGRLEEAYLQYNAELAKQSITNAKLKLKKASESAADTLIELLDKGHEPAIRRLAGKDILSKYIPDKQIVLDTESNEDDLPEALLQAGNKVLDGKANDGPEPVDDPPKGQPASEDAGPAGGEEVPSSVLPEPGKADDAGNPPA